MHRALILACVLSLFMPGVLPAADRIAVERVLTDPQTAEATAATGSLVEQVAGLVNRLFGDSVSLTVRAPGPGDAWVLAVYVTGKGDTPLASLTLTSAKDTGRSASYTWFGAMTPEAPTVLARGVYLLWANLAGLLDRTMAEPPVVVEELPTELLGQNTYPLGLTVTPQGTLVAALGMACVELDSSFGVVRRIGTSLYDAGLYALAYGVSSTPAGTVWLKPGTGRDVYRLAPGAAELQRVPLGVDIASASVVALPDGSLFLLDSARKVAARFQGRQRQDVRVFSTPYASVTAAAAAPDGSLWVWDPLMKGVRVFTTEGNPVDSLLPLVDVNAALSPTSLSVGPDAGFVLFSYGQIVRFRRDGSVAWRITSLPGADDPSLPLSGSVAVDWSRGIVYVADMTGKRIVKLLDVAWCREKGIRADFESGLIALRARRAKDETGALADIARQYEAAGARLMARAWWQKLADADPGNDEAARRVQAIDVEELLASARELDARARSMLASIGLETARPVSVQALQKYELVLSKSPDNEQARAAMTSLRELFSDKAPPPESRPPLTITDVRMSALFPSLMQWYAAHPAGTVTVKNTLREPAGSIRASLFIPRFMDLPSESKTVASLAPGESAVFSLSPAFNQSVLELQEDLPVQAQVAVTWGTGSGERTVTRSVTVTLHRNSALSWDDTRRISSFITPNDEVVSGFAARVIAGADRPAGLALSPRIFQAMRICDAVGAYGISYVPDPDAAIQVVLGKPEAMDTVRFPRTTLFNHTGDCDDTTALLASLLESLGIRTAVLTSPGHIFLAFDTGEPSQNAAYLTGAKLEVLSRGDEAWIPVETTILGQGFMAAWASASELVRKYAPAGPFEMIPVRDMRESYPALPLPASSVSLVDPARGTVDAAFSASLAGFASTLYTGRIADIQAGLAGLAPRQAVKARVQMGILHALFGRVADAETAFRAALKADPTLVSPYVNLANLKIVAGDSAAALAVVTEGLSKNRDSALLNLLAARLYADRGDARSAATYLAVVKKSAPGLAEQFEQTAAGAGAGQSARAGNAAARAPVIWSGDE